MPELNHLKVDPIDEDLLVYEWRALNGYAFLMRRNKAVYLHRVVLERVLGRALMPGEVADHINRDRLDNRRENLRAATPSQSLANRAKRAGLSSRFLGVNYITRGSGRTKRWRAYVTKNGEQVSAGYFSTEIEAARARDELARQILGEFAVLNNV
ncbi:MAG: HNH endonuclease [Dehalococcoidales bacterium]|nr:HNH endonuclease [Dehalococcoidales bacterium]